MKKLFAHSGRVFLTLVMVTMAGLLGWHLWDYYMNAPWTRDGKIRADVVRIAPDVSGLVSEVLVHDNQTVEQGEVIFRIDQARYKLALQLAEAKLASSKAALDMANRDQTRYRKLNDTTVTQQKMEQIETTTQQAEAAYRQAELDRDLASLNLERSSVKAPVNGVITNFSLQRGDYVTTGSAVTALVDTDSFYVSGYFEENKLERIQIGDPVLVDVMGSKVQLKGKVEGIAGGIEDRERTDSTNLLANVSPTFNWVRLAQRVPVRVKLEEVPQGVHLVAGRTVSVSVVN
ncbi:HlyD family secretion protein [Brucella pituitosa]|uniref:efflux RND transporter periplasmic adaptor subunit n=1 Tax=Brucella pituitosa TaxID=571256 RepID=UPI0001C875B5|nr:HlyD family secretion protein [Brucella pituitosa]PQZ48405.1 efflux transporter periplasmic adaptor subunit [Ochrobactrum sp. MYb19]PRA51648.1 efflux transporter periplasmic adaptor subunit [Ochrobactrum sp. MYb68]PRA64588.1 efflux transporter periplasmic adaptor subunit [Ochrobactrum sp. MYb18]PRA74900.1 efflux transporter periplasmic adaptor subunit [Brucella thiophenivorans]PRA83828.1 efflux transporter periplasmic adaptor subunit [Ochrobactrum sp. MYb29]PRA89887.1 efflux transporter pe